MVEFLEDNFLSQLISEATHENNILDFVTVCSDHLINSLVVSKHLDSCDHKVVHSEISTTNAYMYLKIELEYQSLEEATLNISEVHSPIYHCQPKLI